MSQILPPPCFLSFSLFPNYSTSLPIQEMLYELLGTLRGEDLGSRSPFRAPNSQKTAIKYDKLGCHTWGCSWALLGCFWASPGLLGLSESSLAAPACSWLLLGLSCGEFAGTKEKHENDVHHDQLDGSNLSHSEFSGTRGEFGEREICMKYRTHQVLSNSAG